MRLIEWRNECFTEQMVQINEHSESINTLFFYKRPVYKRHEPEICQNFKNKIRECPGWDLVLVVFETFFSRIQIDKMTILQFLLKNW